MVTMQWLWLVRKLVKINFNVNFNACTANTVSVSISELLDRDEIPSNVDKLYLKINISPSSPPHCCHPRVNTA